MEDIRIGRVTIPASEVSFRFTRAGGPGGQNVNKRSTRVEAIFDLKGSSSIPAEVRARAVRRLRSKLDAEGRLRIVAADERTQSANRERAVERLTETLRDAFRPPPKPRRATKPSKAAVERRLADKRARGRLKRGRRFDDSHE